MRNWNCNSPPQLQITITQFLTFLHMIKTHYQTISLSSFKLSHGLRTPSSHECGLSWDQSCKWSLNCGKTAYHQLLCWRQGPHPISIATNNIILLPSIHLTKHFLEIWSFKHCNGLIGQRSLISLAPLVLELTKVTLIRMKSSLKHDRSNVPIEYGQYVNYKITDMDITSFTWMWY